MEPLQDIKLNIDKTNWSLVKLGDVVLEPRDVVKDFSKENIEHVVGLEHIDSEDIHLRRSASIEEETTFTKKFEKGDVLFGRRRAYLKKAARAEFSGICSGDITVLRAKKGLLPELLPFIINNDKFFDYAVKHSAGGLSPRVKFRDLANYEFLLPPKDQQTQIAELLWAMDEVIESEYEVLGKTEIVIKSLYKKFQEDNNGWTKFRIGHLLDLNYGKPLKESDRIEGTFPVVTSAGIQGTHNSYLTEGPGIVVGRKGNAGQVTWLINNFWTTDTAYYVSIKKEHSNIPLKFFYYLLKSANLEKHSIATAVPGLNRDDALMTSVYIPSILEINTFLNKFHTLDSQIEQILSRIELSKSLQKSLINQIF